ncbi:hypothetical protein GCM10010472_39370 [Pseudonocardia halophobica]|uniref:Uncharacterized protein n=1 Tax=Pseudonocardia halophobica TaxID=29401 RepID=A0A9W6NZ62_9PSEU|nr:hypothetical protein GCM10017577_54540 [Pseudonocardia halophobica]
MGSGGRVGSAGDTLVAIMKTLGLSEPLATLKIVVSGQLWSYREYWLHGRRDHEDA